MEKYLIDAGFDIKNGKIVLPEWVKSIKIDIGTSYDAPHTQNWIEQDDRTLVVCFEANPRWIEYITTHPLKRNYNFKDYQPIRPFPYKELDFKNVRNKCYIIPVALSDVENEQMMDFYVTEISEGCCSLLKPVSNFTTSNVVKVTVFPLKDFLKFLPDDFLIDYIKIDVQGCDLKVVKSGGKYISENVIFLTVEPETIQYENSHDNSIENIISYMSSIGFEYINHNNTKDPTFINSKFKELSSNVYIYQYF